MTTFQPLRDYTGYHHILSASACFIHPVTGWAYFAACEQKAGTRQNLVIYRRRGDVQETVATFQGAIDAQSFITMGGCVIDLDGSLLVATSLQPKGVPFATETGFQGVWCRIPAVDEAWDIGGRLRACEAEINRLQRIAAEQQQMILAAGGLEAEDREALEWVKKVRAVG